MSQLSGNQRILRNPLLTNPTKWLNDVPKKHHSNLMQNGFYNRSELSSNPYVQSLTKVDANSSTAVLPVGNAIRLTAVVNAASATTNKRSDITLHPILHLIDDTSNEPGRLISNNKAYIHSIQDSTKLAQTYRPMRMDKSELPSKYKVDFVDNISDEIETLYRDKIETLLRNIRQTQQGSRDGGGIELTDMEGASRWENGRLEVNKSLIGVTDDTFVSFRDHPELSRLIIAYCDYKS
ncbi:hypothetical protein CANMA_004680 [Candida margitis]|uniref:uncharacterized protein n=1 Tax=Candida margitis TaxID=1775924 RepID=UPI002227AF2B|nr:uncharacterized protein CANMA_004680 [Candida margitis]KAI5953842.1 hypothetical protein CANMA_004680 [Candida margitis]